MNFRDARARRRSPHRSSEQVDALENRRPTLPAWEPAVHWIAAAMLLVVVGFQPIRGDDLWWQLSRGSVVASGSIAPSQTLLTMETQADADWLGGLPIYLLFHMLGAHAIMLARVLVIGGGVFWLLAPRRRDTSERLDEQDRTRWRWTGPWVWCVVTVTAFALADQFNGTPEMFDCVAIIALVGLRHGVSPNRLSQPRDGADASASARDRRIPWTIVALVLFVAWSNTASGIFAGLVGWLTWGSPAAENRTHSQGATLRTHWLIAGSMFLGGIVNPRGVNAWLDSLLAVIPSWQNSAAILVDTPWQSLPHAWTESTSLLFFLLTAIWLGYQTQMLRRLPRGWACFLWFQFLAWSNCQNVALACTWMAADVLLDCHASGRWFAAKPMRSGRYLAVSLAGPLCVAVALPLSNLTTTMGWGIDTSLDNRLLQISLASTRPHGTALASDMRSGGMLAWEILQRSRETRPNNIQATNQPPLRLQDVPFRSLITGRLKQQRRILDDLREQRLMSYRRTDDSEGGYWVPLENRQTTLLVVSQGQTDLIRGLEPSIWKPLSLDSPVIAYAQAGDPRYAERMIEILNNREIIEYQPWNFAFPQSTGSIFDRDRWGLRPVLAHADRSWQQAEVFRAMGLRYAALRVLFVAQQEFPKAVAMRCAIVSCQRELADAERIDAGRPSRFRQLAAAGFRLDEACEEPSIESTRRSKWTSLAWDPPLPDALLSGAPAADEPAHAGNETELRARVDKYLRQGPSALLVLTDFESRGAPPDPQLMYAGLCGAIEGGNRELAERYLNWLERDSVDPVLKRLTSIRSEELHPGSAQHQNTQPGDTPSQP